MAAAGIAGVDRLLHGLGRTAAGQQRNEGFPKEVLPGVDISAGATRLGRAPVHLGCAVGIARAPPAPRAAILLIGEDAIASLRRAGAQETALR